MNFNKIIGMYIASLTCPVIHFSGGPYVTCTFFQPGDNNKSMLFYFKNSDNPIEVSGTYDNNEYTYDSDNQTWQRETGIK